MLVSGEAGIGKTSYVKAAADSVQRNITDKELVDGARIVAAANAVEYLASGAASLSF